MYPLLLYDHLGRIYQKSCVHNRNLKVSWESCGTRYVTQKNSNFSNMSPLLCMIIWVSYTQNPRHTLGNPKWAERVVVLAVRRRKSRAFRICIHFYCAIIGVSFAESKIIKAFQWIPLSKKKFAALLISIRWTINDLNDNRYADSSGIYATQVLQKTSVTSFFDNVLQFLFRSPTETREILKETPLRISQLTSDEWSTILFRLTRSWKNMPSRMSQLSTEID